MRLATADVCGEIWSQSDVEFRNTVTMARLWTGIVRGVIGDYLQHELERRNKCKRVGWK